MVTYDPTLGKIRTMSVYKDVTFDQEWRVWRLKRVDPETGECELYIYLQNNHGANQWLLANDADGKMAAQDVKRFGRIIEALRDVGLIPGGR